MKKKISNLINKKNECLRNGEDEKAEQIRMEIRLLKEEAKAVSYTHLTLPTILRV